MSLGRTTNALLGRPAARLRIDARTINETVKRRGFEAPCPLNLRHFTENDTDDQIARTARIARHDMTLRLAVARWSP